MCHLFKATKEVFSYKIFERIIEKQQTGGGGIQAGELLLPLPAGTQTRTRPGHGCQGADARTRMPGRFCEDMATIGH